MATAQDDVPRLVKQWQLSRMGILGDHNSLADHLTPRKGPKRGRQASNRLVAMDIEFMLNPEAEPKPEFWTGAHVTNPSWREVHFERVTGDGGT